VRSIGCAQSNFCRVPTAWLQCELADPDREVEVTTPVPTRDRPAIDQVASRRMLRPGRTPLLARMS
jgi:hypothetical protein